MLFLLPAHLLNALGSILLREESSSPGMNQDFSRSFRDVGCLHPHKQERWPFPRALWHEHNFPGRDSKAQEFTPRMSCFPISRRPLSSWDGNGCRRTGKCMDQLCCSCQCSREAVSESSPSPGSTCSLPGSLEAWNAAVRCGHSTENVDAPRRIRSLPAGHVSGHQSDATGEQQLEPRHLDNFIRSNPSLLCLLRILLLLLEAGGLNQEVSH